MMQCVKVIATKELF